MSIICVKRPPVKPTRHTPHPAAPFGAGVFQRPARFEPTAEDRAAAVLMFADDADWSARMATDADGLSCEACGRPVERGELEGGLCNACQVAAEHATMASQYYSCGLGYRAY